MSKFSVRFKNGVAVGAWFVFSVTALGCSDSDGATQAQGASVQPPNGMLSGAMPGVQPGAVGGAGPATQSGLPAATPGATDMGVGAPAGMAPGTAGPSTGQPMVGMPAMPIMPIMPIMPTAGMPVLDAGPTMPAAGGMMADSIPPTDMMPVAGNMMPEDMTPGTAEPPAMEREDLGVGMGPDVVTIGDSWMQYFVTAGGIEGALSRAGKSYRNYGVAGTRLLDGVIPRQFDSAVRVDADISTVIMTGGGNDILLSPGASTDCAQGGERCMQTLTEIKDTLREVWDKMGAAGVQDIVYIGYAEGAGSTPAEVTNATKNGVSEVCAAMTSIRCHLIDSTPIVNRELADGIHPTPAANDRLASAIIELMEAEGVRR